MCEISTPMTRSRSKMETNHREILEEQVAELVQWRQDSNEQQREFRSAIEEKFKQQEAKEDAFRKSLLEMMRKQLEEIQKGKQAEGTNENNKESRGNQERTIGDSQSTPFIKNGIPYKGEGILPTPDSSPPAEQMVAVEEEPPVAAGEEILAAAEGECSVAAEEEDLVPAEEETVAVVE